MSSRELQLLEEKITWLEEHVAQQDREILDLARRLEAALGALGALRTRVEDLQEGGGSGRLSENERPPHY